MGCWSPPSRPILDRMLEESAAAAFTAEFEATMPSLRVVVRVRVRIRLAVEFEATMPSPMEPKLAPIP